MGDGTQNWIERGRAILGDMLMDPDTETVLTPWEMSQVYELQQRATEGDWSADHCLTFHPLVGKYLEMKFAEDVEIQKWIEQYGRPLLNLVVRADETEEFLTPEEIDQLRELHKRSSWGSWSSADYFEFNRVMEKCAGCKLIKDGFR